MIRGKGKLVNRDRSSNITSFLSFFFLIQWNNVAQFFNR